MRMMMDEDVEDDDDSDDGACFCCIGVFGGLGHGAEKKAPV